MKTKTRRTLQQIIKPDEIAHEAYAVLVQKHAASRRLSKEFLLDRLQERAVYTEFLKLCMEYDYKGDLQSLREGLAIVVKAIGPGKVAKATGLNRVTLYRMLGEDGNPSLNNLTALLRALNLSLWIVDKEFYGLREQVRHRSGRPFRGKKRLASFFKALDRCRIKNNGLLTDPASNLKIF